MTKCINATHPTSGQKHNSDSFYLCEDLVDPTNLNAEDIVIAIMGPTGAGKSNIIDKVTGKAQRAGHGLTSCTREMGAVRIRDHPKHGDRIVLVDTPGFNDTQKSDTEILEIMARWLVTIYESGIFLHGIMYLHQITDIRMSGAHKLELDIFQQILGKHAARKVIFVTTMWDEIEVGDLEETEKREADLKEKYLKEMLDLGASTLRFNNTLESAWKIIDNLLIRPIERVPLLYQEVPSDIGTIQRRTSSALLSNHSLHLQSEQHPKSSSNTGERPRNQSVTCDVGGAQRQFTIDSRNRVHSREITDIVILVMGSTGVGKSTFINALSGGRPMKVGHGLTTCTTNIQVLTMDPVPASLNRNLQGCRLVVVDTPGFDDTYEGDVKILKGIAQWLEQSHINPRNVLGGVIYLHDIATHRFTSTARRNLEVFKHLCGQHAFHKVIFGTTKWARTRADVGKRHEKELSEKYWKSLTDSGSQVLQFTDDASSAWRFIAAVVGDYGDLDCTPLQIQKELVDDKKLIQETEAAKELRYILKEVLEMRKRLASIEKLSPLGENAEAQAKLQETVEAMQGLIDQITELKIPLSRRVRRLIF